MKRKYVISKEKLRQDFRKEDRGYIRIPFVLLRLKIKNGNRERLLNRSELLVAACLMNFDDQIPKTQKEIAELTGVSPHTVSRAFSAFKSNGLIKEI